MDYTDEFLKKITGLGTLGYPLEKILNVLDVPDEAAFAADFYQPGSTVARAYQKGVDQADYVIDMKLFELAKGGDMKALEKYEERKIYQQLADQEQKLKRNEYASSKKQ